MRNYGFALLLLLASSMASAAPIIAEFDYAWLADDYRTVVDTGHGSFITNENTIKQFSITLQGIEFKLVSPVSVSFRRRMDIDSWISGPFSFLLESSDGLQAYVEFPSLEVPINSQWHPLALMFSSVDGWPAFGVLDENYSSGYLSVTRISLRHPVPEPSTIALLCLGLAGLIRRQLS